MAARGTLVYVHGASDRASQVDDHISRIRQQLEPAGLDLELIASRWGEAVGARLDDIELSLPEASLGDPREALAMATIEPTRQDPLAELSRLAAETHERASSVH